MHLTQISNKLKLSLKQELLNSLTFSTIKNFGISKEPKTTPISEELMFIKFKIMLVTKSETKNNTKLITLLKDITTMLLTKSYLITDKNMLMLSLNGYLSPLELKLLKILPNTLLINSKTKLKEISKDIGIITLNLTEYLDTNKLEPNLKFMLNYKEL